MKTREEIMKLGKEHFFHGDRLMMEVLLDIRDMIQKIQNKPKEGG